MEQAASPAGKRKRSGRNVPLRLFLLAAACLLAYRAAVLLRGPVSFATAVYGSLEDKTDVTGYLIRSELVVESPVGGILSCVASENQRVVKDSTVVSVYEGQVDEALQSRLAILQERIFQQERRAVKGDLEIHGEQQIDTVIAKTVEDVIRLSQSGNAANLYTHKNDIARLLRQKNAPPGAPAEQPDELALLLQEKQKLEASFSGRRTDIKTPAAGLFSSVIDGFEGDFSVDALRLLTPENLARLDQKAPAQPDVLTAGAPAFKIIDNYEWYYAAAVPAAWAQDLKEGDYVRLRFPELSAKALGANVHSISPESGGRAVLTLVCGEYEENIYSHRRLGAQIIRTTYSGFQVPRSAVRVLEDGSKGVFIARDGVAKFRNIDILYTGEEFVIAKEDNQMKNGLLLYDEIVMEGSSVEEGAVLR